MHQTDNDVIPARKRIQRTHGLIASVLVALVTTGCGFHLRGTGDVALPDSLSRLRVVSQDTRLVNDPLLVAVKNAIAHDPKVIITEEPDAPALILFNERVESQLLSVGTSGRASGYTLRYEVSFRVVDAKDRSLLSPQTVRQLRDYSFDPLNVLAKEQEEQELKRAMQRDAVSQIMRRLSRYVPPADKP